MDQVTTNGVWAKFFTEMIALVLTGIIATITVFLRKKILESLIKMVEITFRLKIHKDDKIGPEEIRRDIRIQDVLAELRLGTKADRSYIFQFHNGNIFSSRNQMWKLTCTHESVSAGIRPCIGELRDILSSSVSELICPLGNDELTTWPGISKISPTHCECSGKESCKLPNGVYFYEVDLLPEGYAKGLLISEAIVYCIFSPILDSDHNRIGFIGLDYCWKDVNKEEIKNNAEKICKTASVISYELTKKRK